MQFQKTCERNEFSATKVCRYALAHTKEFFFQKRGQKSQRGTFRAKRTPSEYGYEIWQDSKKTFVIAKKVL
jgi:hypothetical protein